jgi:hypothetical protein
MDIHDIVRALLEGDLLAARQWVADAQRAHVDWEQVPQPRDLSDPALCVAAAIVELLAPRMGSVPPAWTKTVGAVRETLVLDPGLEKMPRSFAHAISSGPEPLRSRNLVALPDFLVVA